MTDDVSYAHSPVGELTGLTDQGGNQWVWEFDTRGQQVRSVDPDRGTSTATYDTAGRVTTAVDGRGQALSMVYDKLDRPTERWAGPVGSGTRMVSWAYDTAGVPNSTGLQTSATRWVGGNAHVRGVARFDTQGRPVESYTTVPASEGTLAGTFTSTVGFNAAGGVARTSVPATPGLAGETRTMTYNPTGLVESISGVLAQAEYTSFGEASRTVVSMTAGRFITEERSFEEGTRRLSRQVVARVAPNWGATANAAPVPVRDAAYSYTPAGDLWSVTDTGAVDGVASSRSECFRYDPLGRVTDAWASSTACPAPVGGSPSVGAPALTSTLTGWGRYHARYTYDTLGNRTSVTQRDDAATRTRSWSYPAPGAGVVRPHAPTSTSDQVGTAAPTTQALTYTAAGQQTNRLKASASGSGGPAHTPAVTGQVVAYDAEGRVSTVVTGSSMTRWAYDADGGLLVKDDGVTRTVYLGAGGGGREISRVTATGIRSTTCLLYTSPSPRD